MCNLGSCVNHLYCQEPFERECVKAKHLLPNGVNQHQHLMVTYQDYPHPQLKRYRHKEEIPVEISKIKK